MKSRPYLFYDVAVSICSVCYRRAEGKIVFQDGKVFLLKRCGVHGAQKTLLADDVEYYRSAREVFQKPSAMPERFQTPVRWGCPYDCGLCADHEQHSCLSIIELNDECNLRCPVCYASSGPDRAERRTLAEIDAMLAAVARSELEPDVVQLSGGEPTLHPDFFAVMDRAKALPIKHLMLNTNGLRIASEPEFAKRLAGYMPGFEVYLQFDSFEERALKTLRGADLRAVRERALERLNRLELSTTLVVTLQKGLNDGEVGRIVDFALKQPCVRGVTFQPVQAAGRLDGYDAARDRLTLTEVRRLILEQTDVFAPKDILPVPCHPDNIAMAYALKRPEGPVALTGLIDPKFLIEEGGNTIVYEKDPGLRAKLFDLLSAGHSPASGASSLRDLLCCLPKAAVPEGIGYRDIFRVIIMQFLDAHSFDVRSVKKACVTMARPDGRLIPFDTYNLFYRDGLEQTRLAPLRREAEPTIATAESRAGRRGCAPC